MGAGWWRRRHLSPPRDSIAIGRKKVVRARGHSDKRRSLIIYLGSRGGGWNVELRYPTTLNENNICTLLQRLMIWIIILLIDTRNFKIIYFTRNLFDWNSQVDYLLLPFWCVYFCVVGGVYYDIKKRNLFATTLNSRVGRAFYKFTFDSVSPPQSELK